MRSLRVRPCWGLIAAAGLVSLLSCTSPPAGCEVSGTCPTPPSCPDGFGPDPSDAGCAGVLPAADCSPGTAPVLGHDTCQPLGWTACPTGFVADSSGWGCTPVIAATCAAASRPAIGSAACLDVGDCAAPFPPPGATLFVDPSATVDATHFHSIGAAVNAAPDGGVVAIAPGSYHEAVVLHRAITLVGKCAAQVRLEGPFTQMAGVLVSGARDVTLKGFTVANHALAGVYVYKGGSAQVEDIVAESNTGNGLYVSGPGSHLAARRALVANTTPDSSGKFGWGVGAQDHGQLEVTDSAVLGSSNDGVAVTLNSQGTLTRVVVRDTVPGPSGTPGYGLLVQGASTATMSQSLIERSAGAGLRIQDAQSTATVTESVVRLTAPDAIAYSGHGAAVTSGGSLVLRSSLIADNARTGVIVKDVASSARLESSVIRGSIPFRAGTGAYGVVADQGATLEVVASAVVGAISNGVMVQRGARATVTGSLVRDTVAHPPDLAAKLSGSGVGLMVGQGSTASVDGSAFVANHSVGVVAALLSEPGQAVDPSLPPPTVSLTGSCVLGTLPGAGGTSGYGLEVLAGSQVRLERSVVRGNREAGVLSGEAKSLVELDQTEVSSTATRADGSFGHGLISVLGASATARSSWLCRSAGVGAAFSASSGRLLGTALLDNLIGVHVQGGSVLSAAAGDSAPLGALEVRVTDDCVFAGNVARTGTEPVPLPSAVTP